MKGLTVVQITARSESHLDWLLDSLAPQIKPGEEVHVMQINLHQAAPLQLVHSRFASVWIHPIKPSVWQGPHRLTKVDWWAISSARNTGICLCGTPFISFVDDRCVLMPGYLNSIREAMAGNYAVAGAYEKRFGMKVENGVITDPGEVTGLDPRNNPRVRRPLKTYGGSWCGANYALALEWCLEVNGHDETCDSLGLEDVVFGNMLALNNHITMYDPRMKMVEDRDYSGNGEPMPKRTDKGPFSTTEDKSHKLLEKIGDAKRAIHPLDIQAERQRVQRGYGWTVPPAGPSHDWFDNMALEDFP